METDRVRLPGELWGVTSYFNPAQYTKKLGNLYRFAHHARRQGLRLVIVELAFENAPFTIADDVAERVIRVRSGDVLWQKERLLNIGIGSLPDTCDKVVWLDADALFANEDWVLETSRALERYRTVQPYETVGLLGPEEAPRFNRDPPWPPTAYTALPGAACVAAYSGVRNVDDLRGNNAPGLAFAARRSVISDGLFDRFIVGGGDWVMASAMYLDSTAWKSSPVSQLFTAAQLRDLCEWTDRFYRNVRGSVGYVRGVAYHMWHGSSRNRQYSERYGILRDSEFDPTRDIARDENGCWRWNSDKPELHRQVSEYFSSRREDG